MGTLGRWHAVQTKPHKEALVEECVRSRGIAVYHPKLETPSQVGRKVVSLFPNYLFVRLRSVEDSVSVRYAPGVARLLGIGDQTAPVDECVIDLIRMREGDDGVIRPSRVFKFREMEKVRLRGGPFDDLVALFEHYVEGTNRVQVLMNLLGRTVSVQVGSDDVLPVAL